MQRPEETLKFISSNPPPAVEEEPSFHPRFNLEDALKSPEQLAREAAEISKFTAHVEKPDWPISLMLVLGGFAVLVLLTICVGSWWS
jgi:hypothetical protein